MPFALAAIPVVVRVNASNFDVQHELSRADIREACEWLGVEREIVISHAAYKRGRWQGMHSFANDRHSIRIAWWLSPLGASQTLWHELTHAAQTEQGRSTPGGTTRLSKAEYAVDPTELEARANEALALEHPLAW